MPDSVSFDLKQLIRVCLNDPDLKTEIENAIAEGPLPVRTPIVHVKDGEQTSQAMLKVSREKAPGDAGFLVRDNLGWVSGRLVEIVKTDHDASTISAEQMAEKMGITVDLLKRPQG
jgi:transcription antitermination factor NusA-like protein